MTNAPSDPDTEALLAAFLIQVKGCGYFGSALSSAVIAAMMDDIAAGGVFAELTQPWRGESVQELSNQAVAVRFLGALHHLVLTGAEPALAAVYPPTADIAAAAALVPEIGRKHYAAIQAFVRSPPQTNEVRRSGALMAGLLEIAARTGLPLSLREIGASAGLLQSLDRFHFQFGDVASFGDPAARVHVPLEWSGPAPKISAPLRVLDRRAVDQAPVDIASEDGATRLAAYVWADQEDRVQRLRAAILEARANGVVVEKADAGDWVDEAVRLTPGSTTVLFHSVVWQYIAEPTRARITAHIEALGAEATRESPLAWLSFEPPIDSIAPRVDVRLRLWPGEVDVLLGQAHPHGTKVDWYAP
jgi:hypothetical protein